jgi:hypothetical protein
LLAAGFNVRAREYRRAEALADAQRAVNIMSREIANSGFGLNNNGIVAADSGTDSIRIRSNLNANSVVGDVHEDVKFGVYTDDAPAQPRTYLVRKDINGSTTILAGIDDLTVRYYPGRVSYVTNAEECDISAPNTSSPLVEVAHTNAARYVVISACVKLAKIGAPGTSGYQPPAQVQLVSDVMLRNNNLSDY